jgi:hypothetical protein
VFKRVFKTRASSRDLNNDKDRQNRLVLAVNVEIAAGRFEHDGLSRRSKSARDQAVSLLHALDSGSDTSLEKRLREQEIDLMRCEKRLAELSKQIDFLERCKSILETEFPVSAQALS